jgi:hypothetical protein
MSPNPFQASAILDRLRQWESIMAGPVSASNEGDAGKPRAAHINADYSQFNV